MTDNLYEIYYDEEADFLEVFFGEASESYTEEIEPGVFVRRDEKSDEINSIEILGFAKRKGLLKQILQRFNKKLPLDISLAS